MVDFCLFLFLGKKGKEKLSPPYICIILKSLVEASKRIYLSDRSHAITHMVLTKDRTMEGDKRGQRCRKKKDRENIKQCNMALKKSTGH